MEEDSFINHELTADQSELTKSEDMLECFKSEETNSKDMLEYSKSEETNLKDMQEYFKSEETNSKDMLEYSKSEETKLEVVWAGRTNLSSTDQLKPTLENTPDETSRVKSETQSGGNSSDNLKSFVTQIIEDNANPIYDDSETLPTSEPDEKISEPKMSTEELPSDLDLDVGDSNSLQSYRSELERLRTPSEEQLQAVPLDETYSLLEHLDLSKPINEGRPQLPVRPSISARLQAVLTDGGQWDIKVYIGKYKFYCHLCVLRAYSPYFRHCKVVETNVVRLPSLRVPAQSFHIIYNWMLNDIPPQRKRFSNRCLLELYSAAKYLRIKELIDIVWNTLDIKTNENEAFMLLPDMTYVDMETFDFLCFSRISRFFLTLVASLEFAEMEESYVCRLLSSHHLGVNSEIEIFYAAVRWLTHKWPQRQDHVPELLGSVRFGLLSPIFLRFLQNEQGTRVMDYISKCPAVQERINRAFIYVSAELYCKDPQQSLPFALPEYDVPEQRRWLYDKNCPYHHDLRCSQRQFFTYEQFLAYLETLHETGPDYWRNLEYLLHPVNCCSRALAD